MHRDVLMVDDEVELAVSTTEYLSAFGVECVYVTAGEAALEWLGEHSASVLVLDVNLPGMSGFSVCRQVRLTHAMPILFLSARDSEEDQILGMTMGGDDYLRKPYSLSILLAKVQRALQREGPQQPAAQVINDGHLRVDLGTGRLRVAGEEVRLTALEHRLLECLVSRRGSVVTKRELFEQVWQEPLTSDATLSVHIRRLRRRIEPDPDNPIYIRTVWGRGYLFEFGS